MIEDQCLDQSVSLASCAQEVVDNIETQGIPPSYFVTLTPSNVAKFVKIKEQLVLVIGKAGQQATEELKQKASHEFGSSSQLLFIDTTNQAKAEKLMKQLGVFAAFRDMFEADYSNPHRFTYFEDGGKWTWSALFETEDVAMQWNGWFGQGAVKSNTAWSGWFKKPAEESGAAWSGWFKSGQPSPQTPAIPPPATPPPVTTPEGIKVPPEYSKEDLLTEAESHAASQPMAGYARTLTPANFDLFFIQTGKPVVVAVVDSSIHQGVIDALQQEQQAKPEAERFFIAVLDLSNDATRSILWGRLSKLKQAAKGFVDPSYVRPFALLEYKNGVLSTYHDVDINNDNMFEYENKLKATAPAITELRAENNPATGTAYNLFHKIKKSQIKYPMTVYVVHDPFDLDFQLTAESAQKSGGGSIFYIDWNDPESRFLATHYLGVRPLADGMRYEEWEFGRLTDEHGYFTEVTYAGGIVRTDEEMLALNAVNNDPYGFEYVSEANYDQYFSEAARQDSIVVVGDPRDPDTARLMEQLEQEKRDSGHGLRLVMVLQSPDHKATALLKKLGIKHNANAAAKAYEISWNAQGKRTTVAYDAVGFETVHMGNGVWEDSVTKTSDSVLIVIGSTESSWDSGVASATSNLKSHVVTTMMESNDHSITVAGKKVKKVVYLNYGDVPRIFASEMDNPAQGTIPYEFLHNHEFPQMFLVTGAVGNRKGLILGNFDVSASLACSPDAAPNEPKVVDVVKTSAEMLKLMEELPESKVSFGSAGANVEANFAKVEPTKSAWQMVVNKMGLLGTARFFVVVGEKGSSAVTDSMAKLVGAEDGAKMYFMDTSIEGPDFTASYQKKLVEMDTFLESTFHYASGNLPNPPVFECRQNKTKNASYSCEPHHFSL